MAIRASRWGRAVVVTGVGLAAAYLLLQSVDLRLLGDALARLRPTELLIGFAAYLVFIGLKAARFQALLGGGFSWRMVYGIVCAQTFWSNMLPMRAGDLSYVLMMRGKASVSASRGASSLLVAGALDLWWMLCLGVALGLMFQSQGVESATVSGLIVVAGLGIGGGIAFWIVSRRIDPTWFARVPGIGSRLERLAVDLKQQTWSRPFVLGSIYSAGALAMRYGFQIFLLNRMFHHITPTQGLFALTFAGLINVLPIQGVGNVGSIEAAWTWAMVAVGVGFETGTVSGFALHAVVLLFAGIAGMLSLILLRDGRKETTDAA
ncbi:MAG: lysylphosphatidylglycerol synthase transmembrane domain-containing protein [Candidatus Poribacteria bacterium]|nr:lysylphosphatidylglycerol synthase transmembrane domain-containing protein [Candidatus Poribacteria bacterium]